MRQAIIPDRVLVDGTWRGGTAVVIDDGSIAAITATAELPGDIAREALSGSLVPGFIDTQVNGGGGVLFNDAPTVEGITAIASAHRRFGTTGLLPTLISDDLDVIRRAVAAVNAAIEAGVPGVLGIHIEGPFLNVERKGIHDAGKIRPLDEEGFAVLTSLKRGRTLVTLAPERTTPTMVRRLAEAGVIVAAGHSNGSYEEVNAAVDAGLTGITHLFNAMSPLGSRRPGVVGAALERDELTCGIIVDGHHVSPATLRLALRCKPRDRVMLVTDAMPSVGSDATEFLLQGRRIRVADDLLTDEAGTLAGSNLDMAAAVRNAVTMLGLMLPEAVAMASAVPAAFLGLGHVTGRIAPGLRADLVLMDDDLRTAATWIGGVRDASAAPASGRRETLLSRA
ncbi:N-acetylglucosamine-6-phosphate deacetylase [Sphingomonas cannabina]|uniref:N-acetylglucosamine-6-phosphate deacetylase n=1 Tax=Sphingomonas cannabina TaxID=2899123 RepID=UPI001F214F8B|nr:N-acetylglucosamine-6-phosphate deacetylase [Sphingomonas cannabina]UIJ44319.1 N-acetylglucosamine-6-phosphate deacetylase [Sphingomonas cannabina]